MKVVIIGPAFPFRGGIADTNHNLAMTFKRRGYQTTLVTFTTQYPNFLFPGKNQFSEETPPNLEIHRKINSINPLTWFSSAKFINAINPDIVVVRYWIPYLAPALGFIARRLKAKRVMALCDNVIPHEKRKFDKFLSTYFLNSMDEFITLSEHVATELKSFNKTKVKSLFHPINEGLGSILDKAEIKHELVGYLSESNPADISKFIDKIFTNNDLEEFRENLSIEKEKYTWSSFLDRLLE